MDQLIKSPLECQLIDEMDWIGEALSVISGRLYDGRTLTFDERRDLAFKVGEFAIALREPKKIMEAGKNA